jgi:predicted HAD superfamily Cof-like phosphohydrolase
MSKLTVFKALHEFENAFNPEGKGFTRENLDLRITLIEEEVKEALIEMRRDMSVISKADLTKELADVMYVVLGAGNRLELPLEKVFMRTHQSNMSKLGSDGRPLYRSDGKVLKGPNYQPPVLRDLFDE